jgi:hypothetical protein
VVPDTFQDERFCHNPLVLGDPGIRFYCGAPIIVSGFRLGSLCIIDTIPRPDMDQSATLLLANFADIVAKLILKGQEPHALYDLIDHPSFLVDLSTLGWPILYSNEPAKRQLGNAARLLDFITIDAIPLDSSRSYEPRVLAGVHRGETRCMCYFHPTDQQVMWTGNHNRIYAPDELPEASNESYSFVVVKFDSKDSVVASQLAASFPPSSKVRVVRAADELSALASRTPCVVLFTSRFCGACTRFEEYYKMAVRTMGKPEVQFCVVSVDEASDVVRTCCGGAVFLPIVQFRNGPEITQCATGSWQQFRQSLAAFMRTAAPDPPPLPVHAAADGGVGSGGSAFSSAFSTPAAYGLRLQMLLAAARAGVGTTAPGSAGTTCGAAIETGAQTCDVNGCRIELGP